MQQDAVDAPPMIVVPMRGAGATNCRIAAEQVLWRVSKVTWWPRGARRRAVEPAPVAVRHRFVSETEPTHRVAAKESWPRSGRPYERAVAPPRVARRGPLGSRFPAGTTGRLNRTQKDRRKWAVWPPCSTTHQSLSGRAGSRRCGAVRGLPQINQGTQRAICGSRSMRNASHAPPSVATSDVSGPSESLGSNMSRVS